MNWLKFTMALVLALGFAYLGFNFPANVRSVDERVLKWAGKGTQSIQDLAETRMEQDLVSPVKLFLDAGLVDIPAAKIKEAYSRQYYYPYTGGPDAHFANFLEEIGAVEVGISLAPRGEKNLLSPTIFLLLREKNRQAIESYLATSVSPGIKSLLESRSSPGFQDVDPAHPITGAALDMAVLSTAMLMKGNYFDSRLESWLTEETKRVIEGNDISIEEMKRFYTALLTLTVYLDWAQLKELVREYKDWYTLEKTVVLFRNYAGSSSGFKRPTIRLDDVGKSTGGLQQVEEVKPSDLDKDYRPLLYSAILFSSTPGRVVDYVEKFQTAGFADISKAILFGADALALLLEKQQLIYDLPPTLFFMDFTSHFLGKLQIPSFIGFVVDHPILAMVLKLTCLMLAGAFLIGQFVIGLGGVNLGDREKSSWNSGRFLGYGLVGVVFSFLAVVWVEPLILEGSQPRFDFDVVSLFNTVQIEDMTNLANTADKLAEEVNHNATVGIIIGFLVLQLIIFIIGLLKLQKIKNEAGSTVLKLRLLENEENLFDTGLFVGLGGTVISLILLNTWNLKEASLVAAYASTLFGILFVAILKIGFVRPYRNLLIREQEMIFEE